MHLRIIFDFFSVMCWAYVPFHDCFVCDIRIFLNKYIVAQFICRLSDYILQPVHQTEDIDIIQYTIMIWCCRNYLSILYVLQYKEGSCYWVSRKLLQSIYDEYMYVLFHTQYTVHTFKYFAYKFKTFNQLKNTCRQVVIPCFYSTTWFVLFSFCFFNFMLCTVRMLADLP